MKYRDLSKDDKIEVLNDILNELDDSKIGICEGFDENCDEYKEIERLEGFVVNMIEDL